MTTGPDVAQYFAANAEDADELARLRLIETESDPSTFRYLDTIGVGRGGVVWRLLPVRVQVCVGFLNGWVRRGALLPPMLI